MTRNRIRFVLDDHFRPMGLTDATWRTLFYLEQAGNGVQQKALATIMGIEGPTLVRLLDNLEGRNLIERRPSQQDRRAKSVHLTENAIRLLDSLRQSTTVIRDELLQDFSDKEIEKCLALFDKILARCDAKMEE
ncbi:MAG: MarR family transcriptional regulator [Pseudomonadales bacterium]|nr:MarR family transcriptional regulator [Pseudomonadales bacterium]